MKKLPRLFIFTTLIAAVWIRSSAAITYDLRGTVSFSDSSIYTLGQSVELSFTLPSSVPTFSYSIIPGWLDHDFKISSGFLKIDGTTYILPDFKYVSTGWYPSVYGEEYGFLGQGINTGLIDPVGMQFSLFSSSPSKVDPTSYLPLPGLPLSDFYGPFVRVTDSTYGVGGNFYTGFAEASLKSYTVTSSSVPDESSTAPLLGLGLGLAVAGLRLGARRRNLWV